MSKHEVLTLADVFRLPMFVSRLVVLLRFGIWGRYVLSLDVVFFNGTLHLSMNFTFKFRFARGTSCLRPLVQVTTIVIMREKKTRQLPAQICHFSFSPVKKIIVKLKFMLILHFVRVATPLESLESQGKSGKTEILSGKLRNAANCMVF